MIISFVLAGVIISIAPPHRPQLASVESGIRVSTVLAPRKLPGPMRHIFGAAVTQPYCSRCKAC